MPYFLAFKKLWEMDPLASMIAQIALLDRNKFIEG